MKSFSIITHLLVLMICLCTSVVRAEEAQEQLAEQVPTTDPSATPVETLPQTDAEAQPQEQVAGQEGAAPTGDDSEGSGAKAAQMEKVRQLIYQKLRAMLTNKDGQSSNIVLITPLDYTQSGLTEPVEKIIEDSFKKYGNISIKKQDHELRNVTLEEFRRAMARYDADVMVVCILRNTTFDLYIYDRRTPYYIYAHSEPIPASLTFPMDPRAANKYITLLVRRTLFHYARNQYYELPREESVPILTSEVPRWIASNESLAIVNRETVSNWYAGVALGASMAVGGGGKLWNSNVMSGNVGYRLSQNYYFDFGLDLSAYNSVVLSVKKMFVNKDGAFKFTVGLGLANALGAGGKTLDFDRSFTLRSGTIFLVPQASILYPITDVYLKVDAKIYVGVTGPGFVLVMTPGLMLMF